MKRRELMIDRIGIDDIQVALVFMKIKNLHLRIHSPDETVRVSAPRRTPLKHIRAFVLSKLGWIRKHRERMVARERKTPCQYLDDEVLSLWGRPCHLRVVEKDQPPWVMLDQSCMILETISHERNPDQSVSESPAHPGPPG